MTSVGILKKSRSLAITLRLKKIQTTRNKIKKGTTLYDPYSNIVIEKRAKKLRHFGIFIVF